MILRDVHNSHEMWEETWCVPCTFWRKVATNTTLQAWPKARAKPRGNKETQGLAPLREGMQLITREALNSKIQNLGKAVIVGKRHFGLFKDLVLIVGRVREIRENFLCIWKCSAHLE